MNANCLVSEKEGKVKILPNIVIKKGKKRPSPDWDDQAAKKNKTDGVTVDKKPQLVDKEKADKPKAVAPDLEKYLEQVADVVSAVIGWAEKFQTQPDLYNKKLKSLYRYVFKN